MFTPDVKTALQAPTEADGIDYELAWRGACSQIDDIAKERDDAENELNACTAALPGPYYMDPPDGGGVSVSEQVERMAKDAERYRHMRDNSAFRERNGPGLYWYLPRFLRGNSAEQLDAAIDEALSQKSDK